MKNTAAPRHPSLAILVVLLLCVATVFRYFWWVSGWFIPPSALASAPTTSDIIAAASALFSAFAFVGLIYTIMLQRHELLTQRLDQEELREHVLRQAFDSSFFQLLRLHNDNVRSQSVQLRHDNAAVTGRRAFMEAASEVEQSIAEHLENDAHPRMTIAEVNRIYSSICETPSSDFAHYFRNLYHIIKYVDASAVIDKSQYAAQVRAQLSQHEFLLLLANGLRRSGRSKFKPFIERYALLHGIRESPTVERLRSFYDKSAFGGPDTAE